MKNKIGLPINSSPPAPLRKRAARSTVPNKVVAPEATTEPADINFKPRPEDWDVPSTQYNCFNCNAMCCSVYERVALKSDDIERLARHFNMNRRTFLRTYTHRNSGEVCLNRVPDEILGNTCVLLNQKTRLCGVHLVRPQVCREWPPDETEGRCVYYDVLQFERYFQQDPNVAIRIEINTYSDGSHQGIEYEGPSSAHCDDV
jgi:Fe-S-cluster containining protein